MPETMRAVIYERTGPEVESSPFFQTLLDRWSPTSIRYSSISGTSEDGGWHWGGAGAGAEGPAGSGRGLKDTLVPPGGLTHSACP